MPALSYYSNVHNTALVILKNKGWQVWYNAEQEMFCCEQDGWDLWAEDPVQLLGLVSIYEVRKPSECVEYWWRVNEPWLNDSVPSAPKPFEEVLRKR